MSDQSFGFEMTLNFGAAGLSPMRQRPQTEETEAPVGDVVQQSKAARCSSVNLEDTHTIVTACKPAA